MLEDWNQRVNDDQCALVEQSTMVEEAFGPDVEEQNLKCNNYWLVLKS